jgi:mycothiol synthase
MATMKTKLPLHYSIRAPVESDIPAIIELIIALDLKHYGVADEYSSDDIQDDWSRLDPRTDAWVVLAPTGQLAAYGTVTDQGSGHITADGYVHPKFAGQGIGTELVNLLEMRAQEIVHRAPPEARVVLENSVLQSDIPAQSILESAGFSLARTFWRMAIEFTEPPRAPTWPRGISLQTFATGQEHAVFEAVEEAFQDHWGHVPRTYADWIQRTERESFDSSLWFLAMEDQEIAGVALCRVRPDNSAWVNTVAVRRPWRQRGLGTALLLAAFNEFYRRNILHAALGVDAESLTGANRLYERAGMQVSLRIATYQKELRPGRDLATKSPPEAAHVETGVESLR